MNPYIIATLFLFILTGAAVCLRLCKKRIPETIQDTVASHGAEDDITSAAAQCQDIVCNALDHMADENSVEVCRNDRKASGILYDLSRRIHCRFREDIPADDIRAIYLIYMIEAADKISETTRRIATSPEYRISIAEKCEIMAIRNMDCEMIPDFLKHLIAETSRSMSHKYFSDESGAYAYLMLLYYLRSFFNSYHRLIAILSQPNRI